MFFVQGTLWKRSERSLNKEWKKKYVTLSNSGMLTYHSNINVSNTLNTQIKQTKESLAMYCYRST